MKRNLWMCSYLKEIAVYGEEISPITPFFSVLFIYAFIYLLYNVVLVLTYIDMNLPWVYMCSHPEPPSHLLPHLIPQGHPSAPAPSTDVSCIKPGLAICFIYDNIHVSMLFSQIILPSPSSTKSKRLFYTSVSLLLSHI